MVQLIKNYITKKSTKKPDFMKYLGRFSIGIKQAYKHRSDIYEEHLKRKMGFCSDKVAGLGKNIWGKGEEYIEKQRQEWDAK